MAQLDYSKLSDEELLKLAKQEQSDNRPDKNTREKGLGYFGKLKRPGGGYSTERSIGVNIDGEEVEIPSLVPTLTEKEKEYLLSGKKPTSEIIQKAIDHAQGRKKEGKNPFAQEGEQKIDYSKLSDQELVNLAKEEQSKAPRKLGKGESAVVGLAEGVVYPIYLLSRLADKIAPERPAWLEEQPVEKPFQELSFLEQLAYGDDDMAPPTLFGLSNKEKERENVDP